MTMQKPNAEFISLDLSDAVATVSCPDSVTDGGTYCVDSSVTTDCGTPMQATNG